MPAPVAPDIRVGHVHLKVADPARRVVPLLALETSRGCWWGAKHHCTFCSFGGRDQVFRS
ncbi:MAG: hypothetical protein RL304_694, partial [Verrucomicrobiota bacterium]